MEGLGLLSIPTELRLLILEFLLTSPTSLAVGGSYRPSFVNHSTPPAVFGSDSTEKTQAIQPAISFTSRQLRAEALPIFYACNCFQLALHYRRARAEVVRWLDSAVQNTGVASNLWHITIKHRFGILDYRGNIDLNLKDFHINGPYLWFNSIPPIYIKEVESIVEQSRRRSLLCSKERSGELIIDTLRQLIEVLGVVLD